MTGNGEPLPKIYLKPGELLVAEDPVKVLTVLGSCISVTMYAARTGVSAICHAMLPTDSGSDNFKFVDSSLQHMLEYFKQHRITRGEIQVKLFGPADREETLKPLLRQILDGLDGKSNWFSSAAPSAVAERENYGTVLLCLGIVGIVAGLVILWFV